MNYAEIRKIVSEVQANQDKYPAVLVAFTGYFKAADDNIKANAQILRDNNEVALDIFRTMGRHSVRFIRHVGITRFREMEREIAARHNWTHTQVSEFRNHAEIIHNSMDERRYQARQVKIYWVVYNAKGEQLRALHSCLAYNINKQGDGKELAAAFPLIHSCNPEHVSEILTFRLLNG